MTNVKNKEEKLIEALFDAGSHLIGATSAYRQYARRYKTRGPSDPFYTTRIKDMEKACERVQKVLRELK